MPFRTYGSYRNYRKKNYKRRPSTTANKPVRAAIKTYKKAPAPRASTRQYTTNNRNAIMTLSRQVKSLQLSKLGQYQSNREYITFNPGGNFGIKKPMCFCVNDFVHYGTGSSANVGVPTWTTDNADASVKISNLVTFTRNIPVTGTNEKNWYDFKLQDNSASKVCYQPISSTMNFALKFATMQPGTKPFLVRIDIVRQKKTLNNGLRVLALPDSIGGLANMAEENPAYRNHYNKEYFQVLQTKYLYCSNKDSAAKDVRSYKTLHVPLSGILRPDADAVDNAGNFTDFYNNIEHQKKIWCIVSFSNDTNIGDVELGIMKTNRWRDQHGTD